MGRRLWWRLWGHSVARVQKVQRVHRVQRVVVAASPQFKKGGVAAMGFMGDRKLFAKGFLSDLISLCFIAPGNCSPGDFSTSLEMTGGRGTTVFHRGRKLFRREISRLRSK